MFLQDLSYKFCQLSFLYFTFESTISFMDANIAILQVISFIFKSLIFGMSLEAFQLIRIFCSSRHLIVYYNFRWQIVLIKFIVFIGYKETNFL
jgi:hypothetical protein